MPLPEAITTCALNIGPLSDFAGDAHSFKVEWQPVLDGLPLAGNVRSITWEATGLALASFSEKAETNVGGTITANLPHVDQAGFIDGSGDAFTGWTYRVKVTARDTDRKTYTKTKYIAPLVGQTTADFDLIADGTVAVPVTTPSPTVTSYNGQTGAVTGPSDADVSEVADAVVALADVVDDKQPLATMLTQFVDLAPTMTDGQLFGWDGVLDEPAAANPPGERLASNRNVTNTVTGMTAASGVGGGFGTIVTIPSTAISVEDSNGRPGVIKFGAALSQTAVGVCVAQLYVYETTVGNTGYRATKARSLPGIAIPFQVGYEWDGLGVVTTTRTFELRSRLYTSSASMSAQWANTEAEPTFIRAVTE